MQATTTPRLAGHGSATPPLAALFVAGAVAIGALIGINLAVQQPAKADPAPAYLEGAASRLPSDDMVGTSLGSGGLTTGGFHDGASSRLPSDDMIGTTGAAWTVNGFNPGYHGSLSGAMTAGYLEGAASRLPTDDMVGSRIAAGSQFGGTGYLEGAASRLPTDDMVGKVLASGRAFDPNANPGEIIAANVARGGWSVSGFNPGYHGALSGSQAEAPIVERGDGKLPAPELESDRTIVAKHVGGKRPQ